MLNEQDVIELAAGDAWMMEVLRAARSLALPDWWVCAGFVRSKIWDTLHGFAARTPLADVDVVFFDPACPDEAVEKELERRLHDKLPGIPWSVKNQARMHVVNGNPPYSSSVDAISKFPETATALGLRLDGDDRIVLTAPCGIEDAVNLTVRPTPLFAQPGLANVYASRIAKKDWQRTWHRVRIEMPFA